MTAPQHRTAGGPVQRLEAAAFTLGADVSEAKAAVEQLPAAIRQEILEYTKPVFGEIMAGRATLATKQDLEAFEQRLVDLVQNRMGALDAKVDQILAALPAGGTA
ncbi:hypothetical protein [Nonomuraea dietziae]|uniref:hypothetical protein n=1 Tax=Nonomuraea dietziae TaxID=65515 RepID=UPI0033F69996